MKKLIADMHTHTLASGHAYGTIREMAQAASEKNLQILGISEHGPGIPGTVEPIYFRNLTAVPQELYGVRVLHGCEVNVLDGGKLSLGDRYLECLDYGIVGIHSLCYTDKGKDKNTDELIECMKNPYIFFVSHPDDDHTPLDYERLVKAAKQYHVALELNNSSLLKPEHRLNCYSNYETMLNLCQKYDSPIIISSDAHDPSAVARHNLAIELVEKLNFPDELILNNDADKLKQFINL